MGNFNRDSKRSGGGFSRGFGGRDKSFHGGRDRDGGRPMMHQATCSECGKECELPFRPSGDRPVFCSQCFEKQGDGGASRPSKFGGRDRGRDRSRGRDRFEDKQMFDVVCSKCGKDCQVPFKPMSDKPLFCNDCFEKNDSGGRGRRDSSGAGVMEQIKILNIKVDKLMKFLMPNVSVEKKAKSEGKKEVIIEEVIVENIVKEKKEKPEAKKEIVVEEVVKGKKGKSKIKVATKKVSTKKKK